MGRFRDTLCCCFKTDARKQSALSSNQPTSSTQATEAILATTAPSSPRNVAAEAEEQTADKASRRAAVLVAGTNEASPEPEADAAQNVVVEASSEANVETKQVAVDAVATETVKEDPSTASATPGVAVATSLGDIMSDAAADGLSDKADSYIENQMMGVLRQRLQGPPGDGFIAKLGEALDYECSMGAYRLLCALVQQAEAGDAKAKTEAEAVALAISDRSYVRACEASGPKIEPAADESEEVQVEEQSVKVEPATEIVKVVSEGEDNNHTHDTPCLAEQTEKEPQQKTNKCADDDKVEVEGEKEPQSPITTAIQQAVAEAGGVIIQESPGQQE